MINEMTSNSIEFNPLDANFRVDPYPTYHRLRSQNPIHRHFMGSWMITRYADAVKVLRDSRFGGDNLPRRIADKNQYLAEETADFKALIQAISSWLLYLEPPNHSRMRSLVGKAFYPKIVEQLRPQVQQIVDEILERAKNRGNIEIVSELARPLPIKTISQLLGIPKELQEQISNWTDEITAILDPLNSLATLIRIDKTIQDFTECLSRLIVEKTKRPQADLMSALIAARDRGDKLSDREIISVCIFLFGAGEESTSNLIGNAVLALLQHPDQRLLLQQNPHAIATAVEEFLRYDSPVQGIARIAKEDVALGDKHIHQGEQVFISLGAANRDPLQFKDPDKLDLTRNPNPHIAFADGIHRCLGAALARMEGQIAIASLVRQFPDFQLQPGHSLEWRKNINLRGLKALPVTF